MKKLFKFLGIFTLFLLLSCENNVKTSSTRSEMRKQWQEASDKLKVLSTIAMINDLVEYIGGDRIVNLTLIQGELDPHTYQLVKGDDEKLAQADIIFFNGLGLEHGPSLQRYLQGNKNAVGLGNKIQDQSPHLILNYQGQIDPHIWMDISLWKETIPFIVETLSQKDPKNALFYEENGQKLTAEMQQLHENAKKELMAIPSENRFLITSHDAFNYFARAYLATEEELIDNSWQKRFAAPEGLAPESQLSTTDIQFIIDHVKRYNIHVLFTESNVSKDSIRKILTAGKEKGLDLRIAKEPLYADALGMPGGETYFKMVMHNVDVIVSELNPK